MKEKFQINEDEIRAIVMVMRGMRLFSKHKTTASLYDYLMNEEICNRAEGKLYWKEPMLKLFKQVEDKFNTRLASNLNISP